ncbi:MAG: efflux RND transporter permease subunit [Bacilli bacterium]|nr:efflux RND transporter permease subunit [Bacilli bacterium]
MKNLPKFSINRPIAIIMGIMIILILGIISLFNLTSELLPSINFPYAIISTTYPGASPELIENVVTKPIESSMATVSNINDISSISNENYSIVMLEFSESTNLDAISIEMSEKLDMLTGIFPDEVTKPMVIKLNPNMIPIMQFAISFKDKDIIETSNLVKNNILSKLESVPGVAQVQLIGSTEDTINITLNEDKINELNNNYQAIFKQQGLPFTPININSEMIKGILAGQNMEIPVGYINDNNKETLVRIGNRIKSINELKQLPIISNPMMEVIIDDIANVNIKSNEENSYSKVNGEHALIISIQKQSNYATSEVINDINTRIDEIKLEYQTMEINMLLDQAKYINLTINSVLKNLIYGAILAIIVLIFFLKDIRPTIIIGIAIPISVIATFIMIYFYGIH